MGLSTLTTQHKMQAISLPLVKIADIKIASDRQRKQFTQDALMELAEELVSSGLLHPPVVRETPEGLVLVAGERRLRAIELVSLMGKTLWCNGVAIPEGFVPVSTIGSVTVLKAEGAELGENTARENLTWQEQAAATQRVHALRTAQAAEEGRIHTVRDTALEVRGSAEGSQHNAVRQELLVAQHLSNPAVAAAKSTADAFKILKKQEEARQLTALAIRVGATYSASVHTLLHTDCLDFMRTTQAEQFDVILTDPPYGMGADNFSDAGGKLVNHDHQYKDDYESFMTLMMQWCKLSYRVAKPQCHAYVFCDIDNFHALRDWMREAGWYVFRTPFICVKPGSGRVPLPDEGPRRQWECLLYAIKGHKKTTAIYPDVISSTLESSLGHGAQKPVELFENLLRRSARPGDTVLDSFCGSGTIFPAAHSLKLKATGCELSPQYYGMALTRLRNVETETAAKPFDTANFLSAPL